ncbi:DNA repair protein RecN [Ornithinimicrobium tianjinense]|uniref:DNA repair protein RecN n=1 Tax=Ornithinimicrobium tianjinense TaxID=1195761 RepID=A0A917BLV2_9MICO|nr:DNA repair protein RecN [Ornithinimicrobium tianjinense]GGF48653.1 DNA repair protein RecN [Ornithinimicrobium tianjinense]
MTFRRIRIQGLGVIDDAELELTDGLNVITGETGAGKTMVVSGLGLLLGARADAGLVRVGVGQAVVEGEVDVPVDHPAARRVEEAGGDVADGLLLARTVAAEGRSRAHVGGRSAPVGVLTEVGEHLVAVHGQADQWRLRDAEQHRILLDEAGGRQIADALAAYRARYEAWLASRARLAELARTSVERELRITTLRSALEEIEAVDPQEGEEDTLRAESERLTYAEELRNAAQQAHDLLAGPDGMGEDQPFAGELLSGAAAALAPASAHDEELAGLRQRLEEIAYLTADLAADLASYASGIEVDEERLDEVHRRRSELGALLRRFGPGTVEALAFARSAAVELATLDISDEDRAALAEATTALGSEVGRLGWELSELRRQTAERVGQEVGAELRHLAMGSATLSVHVAPRVVEPAERDDESGLVPLPDGRTAQPRSHGLDEVEIRLAANPGAPARSVARAASGGELSRVMLALEVVCGGGGVPTYVFDEVDAGVGGRAALDLGARLARLADTAQVIVVTHLGQVAAYADRHLVVRKSTDGQVTRSGVAVVEGAEREAEVARMLGGVADSEAALEHARELIGRRAAGAAS